MASTLKQTKSKQSSFTEKKIEEIQIPYIKPPEPNAAETAANTQASSAAESFAADVQWHQSMQGDKAERLRKIIGIFKDEPLLDALMDRIHDDQRRGIEQFKQEAEAEG